MTYLPGQGVAPTVDLVVDILASDHTLSSTQGRLRALTMDNRCPSFLRELAEAPRRQLPKKIPHRSKTSGIFLNPRRASSRSLTHGEAVWLTTLPDDPRQVTDEDVKALATLEHEVREVGDKRLVASKFDNVKRLEQARHEIEGAESELMLLPMPTDPTRLPQWPAAREFLGKRIRQQTPDLDQAEAEARATRLVTEAWQPNTAKRNDLRKRVGDLCREHEIEGTYFEGTSRWGVPGDDNKTTLRPTSGEAA